MNKILRYNAEKNTPSLLLVDDDEIFCSVLKKALIKRGFDVSVANDVENGLLVARKCLPSYAVIDLRMPGPSGLELVPQLQNRYPEIKIVVLTGYASIATAVESIKLGAVHYLTKPADADEIIAAFHRIDGDISVEPSGEPISVNRLEWEHIQKVLSDCGGNVSAAARQLGMHRRTLQRKLSKHPSQR